MSQFMIKEEGEVMVFYDNSLYLKDNYASPNTGWHDLINKIALLSKGEMR